MPTRGAQSAAKFDLGHLLRIQRLKLWQSKAEILADPHGYVNLSGVVCWNFRQQSLPWTVDVLQIASAIGVC